MATVIDKAHSASLEIRTLAAVRAFDHWCSEFQVGSKNCYEDDASR